MLSLTPSFYRVVADYHRAAARRATKGKAVMLHYVKADQPFFIHGRRIPPRALATGMPGMLYKPYRTRTCY